MIVSRTVHIRAPVERVFNVLADPAKRARLNPVNAPLLAEVEGGGPLRIGSRCHYRLHTGKGVVEYRTRIQEFEPMRRIVSISDTAVPFKVELEMGPEGDGTRVTQTESFEPSDDMLEAAAAEGLSARGRLTYWVFCLVGADASLRLRSHHERALQRQLEDNLERWLEGIRNHLEHPVGEPARVSASR